MTFSCRDASSSSNNTTIGEFNDLDMIAYSTILMISGVDSSNVHESINQFLHSLLSTDSNTELCVASTSAFVKNFYRPKYPNASINDEYDWTNVVETDFENDQHRIVIIDDYVPTADEFDTKNWFTNMTCIITLKSTTILTASLLDQVDYIFLFDNTGGANNQIYNHYAGVIGNGQLYGRMLKACNNSGCAMVLNVSVSKPIMSWFKTKEWIGISKENDLVLVSDDRNETESETNHCSNTTPADDSDCSNESDDEPLLQLKYADATTEINFRTSDLYNHKAIELVCSHIMGLKLLEKNSTKPDSRSSYPINIIDI